MNIDQLTRGCASVEPRQDLKALLASDRPLRVKLGIDPTSPDLHLGHAVPLALLQRFVEADHKAILVIGDFTAKIGDPTGRNSQRPPLTDAQIEQNLATFTEQAGRVLDMSRVGVRRNSEWLSTLPFSEVLGLLAHSTVAQMLERADFKARFEGHTPISLHEFVYPLAQAMDSVHLGADIEIGGTDQTFNLHMGRSLQQAKGLKPQVCITVPILEGIDGIKKMSKTAGNAIGITETADAMFGKVMLLPDDLEVINSWGTLLADWDETQVRLSRDFETNTELEQNLFSLKKFLACGIVDRFHSQEKASAAMGRFERTMNGMPSDEDMQTVVIEGGEGLDELLVRTGLVESKRAARRLIAGGGVRLNDKTLRDERAAAESGILRVGARGFLNLVRVS